jgi:hypothetical protein
MQILEIVLYGNNGEKRTVPFNIGAVNIITGKSGTGKSALIEIIDYCLGRTESTVPDGVIRDKVAWFGLLLQFEKGQVFVARQTPPSHTNRNNKAFILEGEKVESPETAPKEPNTNIESIENELTLRLGISPNLNTPEIGETRLQLEANIRHALFYCFQHQNDIATKHYLFYRQYEDYVPQSMKDTLPYFLGAIQENRLALEHALFRAKRELKRAEQLLNEANSIRGDGVSKGIGLVAEARQVGLIGEIETSPKIEEIVPILQSLEEWSPNMPVFQGTQSVTQLQEEVRTLEQQYVDTTDSINAVKTFANEAEGYSSEAHKQELRLESIGLFNGDGQNAHVCPACSQDMKTPVPTADALRLSLERLKSTLDATTKERPRLRDFIEKLELDREEILKRIREKTENINGIFEAQADAQRVRDLNSRRARVTGRVSLWLESIDLTDNSSELLADVENKRLRVRALEQELSGTEKEEILSSILNRIGLQMTEWSKQLQLEHQNSPMRLDISKLTAVVDKEDRPMPLINVGSAQNWLGIHLITHFALHKHFVTHNRPVPNFLFLDQPTQVYYPKERDNELQGSMEESSDEDKEAVSRIFKLIFEVVKSLAPKFQIIITDHADLKDKDFQKSVIARWRGDEALIPKEWLEEPTEEKTEETANN